MNAALPIVDSMTSLFTPAILFCIVNLVIGTIFITSRLKSHNKPDPAANSPPSQNQLVRAPSFLDRVKSFNFSSYVSEQPDPFHAVTQKSDPREEQEQKNVAQEEALLESHHHDDQMMKSKLQTRVEAPAGNGGPARRMKKSASEKAVAVPEDREEVDRWRPATMREREGRSSSETETLTFGEEEHVDKKADAFINRFRQHLKLQRLDSILRYKEMLNRGAGLES
ncbi:unnamed protein product [Coffea canephora]|uniref:DUF4408 domain-containing protein n=2 Tax=Coffea TaxID=13442 RepID=A0A068U4D5_COFCA|nr:pathogen-associated molecular patterns-induced protein A70-like [Coffea arabica]CDP03157.1 unnamed protein product [Coffea canephora]